MMLNALAIIGVVALVALLAAGLWYWRKRQRLALQQWQDRVIRLERELSAVNNAAIGVGQRLMALEKKYKSNLDQQRRFEPDDYKQAEVLAAEGAEVSDLMRQCGLSEAEAELMSRLKARGEVDIS